MGHLSITRPEKWVIEISEKMPATWEMLSQIDTDQEQSVCWFLDSPALRLLPISPKSCEKHSSGHGKLVRYSIGLIPFGALRRKRTWPSGVAGAAKINVQVSVKLSLPWPWLEMYYLIAIVNTQNVSCSNGLAKALAKKAWETGLASPESTSKLVTVCL